ncbi:MAG: hypothetical protein PSY14_12935 [bacterium]|nr:hypothetical protein [bacterium]
MAFLAAAAQGRPVLEEAAQERVPRFLSLADAPRPAPQAWTGDMRRGVMNAPTVRCEAQSWSNGHALCDVQQMVARAYCFRLFSVIEHAGIRFQVADLAYLSDFSWMPKPLWHRLIRYHPQPLSFGARK